MTIPLPNFDDHTYEDLVELARKLIPREYPEWTDHNPTDPGIILLELLAWLTEMVLYRVNQVPDENYRTFLKLLKPQEEWDKLKNNNDLQEAIRQTVLDLQKRYRAVTCEDFEKLVLEDWNQTEQAQNLGEVKRAKCLPQHNLAVTDEAARDALAPGHISLVIVPKIPYNVLNNELMFNGEDNYVEVPSHTNPTNAITVEAWIKSHTSNWNNHACLLSKRDAYILHPLAGGKQLRFYIWIPPKWNYVESTLTIDLTQWHHYAGTFDGTILRLYIDGEEVNQNKVTGKIQVDTGSLCIGKDDQTAQSWYFNGQIAECRIWKTAHTAKQIQADMYRQLTGKEEGLVGYWPLDEGSGTTVYDKTSKGNNGTIHGAQWTTDSDLKVDKILIPTPQLRSALWKYLDERRLVTTRHHVVEPDYVPVKISAKLWLMDGADSQNVSTRAKEKVRQFFDPLEGGWDGKGWPFGRSVYISEVYSLLDNVDGVDYVTDVKLNGSDKAIALLEYQLVAVQIEENSFTIQEAWRIQDKG